MKVATISAYETTAGKFFEGLKAVKADLVLDVRLKNTNQLCGFTKRDDLAYFVPRLTGAHYVHDPRFAPTPELLARYVAHQLDFDGYAAEYGKLLSARKAMAAFRKDYGAFQSIVILGAATRKRRSHAEALADRILSHGNGLPVFGA